MEMEMVHLHGGERECEREREGETDRQTDRQIGYVSDIFGLQY